MSIEVQVVRTGSTQWSVRWTSEFEPWTSWGRFGSSTAAVTAARVLEGLGDLIVWRSSG